MDNESVFIERLNELLDRDPRNDTEIAAALGVSKQTVSSWKHGKRSPKKSKIIKIANEFNVSPDWLFGYDVPRSTLNLPEYRQDFSDEVINLVKEALSRRETSLPKTKEARIISGGIDKMPREKREQALKVFQTIFADYADQFIPEEEEP